VTVSSSTALATVITPNIQWAGNILHIIDTVSSQQGAHY